MAFVSVHKTQMGLETRRMLISPAVLRKRDCYVLLSLNATT